MHIAADYGPYGTARDERVDAALAEHDIELVRTGSPYAVAPGRVTKGDGHAVPGLHAVLPGLGRPRLARRRPAPRPPVELARASRLRRHPRARRSPTGSTLPEGRRGRPPGGAGATSVATGSTAYDRQRDRPDLDATSHMSVHLKWGEIHPRTMLADLAGLRGAGRRDVPHRSWPGGSSTPTCCSTGPRPRATTSARSSRGWPTTTPATSSRRGARAAPASRSSTPGMRQLRATGWMHNRVRMIVASFLVKDLHVEWQHGARHFLHWLVDGDLASNQHGWQWMAGCGTDAAPYFRVFNPVTQGRSSTPTAPTSGGGCPSSRDADDPPRAALDPIVDHAEERARRWTATRGSRR